MWCMRDWLLWKIDWVMGFAIGGEGKGVFGRGFCCLLVGCPTVDIMGRTLLRVSWLWEFGGTTLISLGRILVNTSKLLWTLLWTDFDIQGKICLVDTFSFLGVKSHVASNILLNRSEVYTRAHKCPTFIALSIKSNPRAWYPATSKDPPACAVSLACHWSTPRKNNCL